jgi:hypothetical protein
VNESGCEAVGAELMGKLVGPLKVKGLEKEGDDGEVLWDGLSWEEVGVGDWDMQSSPGLNLSRFMVIVMATIFLHSPA